MIGGQLDFPAVAFLRGEVTFDSAGTGSIGTLPVGSVVYDAMLVVTEEFNAGGNSLWFGTAASPLLFIGFTVNGSVAPGVYHGIEKAGIAVAAPAGGLEVFLRHEQTGTDATTGRAVAYLLYLPSMR